MLQLFRSIEQLKIQKAKLSNEIRGFNTEEAKGVFKDFSEEDYLEKEETKRLSHYVLNSIKEEIHKREQILITVNTNNSLVLNSLLTFLN